MFGIVWMASILKEERIRWTRWQHKNLAKVDFYKIMETNLFTLEKKVEIYQQH